MQFLQRRPTEGWTNCTIILDVVSCAILACNLCIGPTRIAACCKDCTQIKRVGKYWYLFIAISMYAFLSRADMGPKTWRLLGNLLKWNYSRSVTRSTAGLNWPKYLLESYENLTKCCWISVISKLIKQWRRGDKRCRHDAVLLKATAVRPVTPHAPSLPILLPAHGFLLAIH